MNLGSGWVGTSPEVGGRKMHVKKLLGEGGFAFVNLVVDGFSGEQIVMKRQLLQNQQSRAVAEREASLLSRLHHPNIVQALGTEVLPGKVPEAIILMEYCDGGHLFDIMSKMQVHTARARARADRSADAT